MDTYRIYPDTSIDLEKIDASDTGPYKSKNKRVEQVRLKLRSELEELQELLYAEQKHKVLVVLQAMDTGGKDGVIRSVFDGVNPQGVRVASFKVPTPQELAHDFLWRVHKQTPGKGEITIFNRSHYEDVLVVRVHNWITPEVCQRRYETIRQFEKLLADEGTTILKFYLHISMDEQKKRLQSRLDDPTKHWKFSIGDLADRKLWADYMHAYEDAINATSTDYAPWYVVPANKKWYRDIVIGTVMTSALKCLKMHYPVSKDDLSKVVIE